MEGQSASYTFQVPVTHGYFMAFRYSLYPLSWYNTVYLYGAESLSRSGSRFISNYTAPPDNPSRWRLAISIFDSSNVLVKSTSLTVGSLYVGEGSIWSDVSLIQLMAGRSYRMAISYVSSGGSFGVPWPLLVDSVILMPDLTTISYFNTQSVAKRNEIQQCYMKSKELQTMPSMLPVCRQHTFGFSVLMYNGTLRKYLVLNTNS